MSNVSHDTHVCRTSLMRYFNLVILFEAGCVLRNTSAGRELWSWPWPLNSIRPILIYYLLNSLGSLWAKFVLPAVIGPVSVADKAISTGFDLWHDLDLTCDFWSFFLTSLKNHSSRAFDCRSARLATANRSRVRKGGGRIRPPAGRLRPNIPAGRELWNMSLLSCSSLHDKRCL